MSADMDIGYPYGLARAYWPIADVQYAMSILVEHGISVSAHPRYPWHPQLFAHWRFRRWPQRPHGHHGNGVLRWLRWHRVMAVIASCVGRDDILAMPKIESWYVEFMFWFLPHPSMSIINVVNYYNPSAFSNILIIVLHHYNNYSFK